MFRPILLLSATLCCACQTTAARGLTPVLVQRQYPVLSSQQPCSSDPEAVRVADLSLALLLWSAEQRGLGRYEEMAGQIGRPLVCLVEHAEQCAGVLAAGCTQGSVSWVARDRGWWPATLMHEIGEQLSAALRIHWGTAHDGPWQRVQVPAEQALRATEFLLR